MSTLTTINNKPAAKTVGDPNASYVSMRTTWERARAIMNGQAHARAYDDTIDVVDYTNLLLPFSPLMNQQQYKWYRSEGELPGLVNQYTKVLVGGLLRKPPQYSLPKSVPEDAIQWLNNSFSADGNSMISFLDQALWEELQTSRAWAVVDMPSISAAEQDSMTKEERDAITPYVVLYKAENVTNWRRGAKRGNKANTLTKFTLRFFEEDAAENEHHPELKDTVLDYVVANGTLVVTKYRKEEVNQTKQIVNGAVKNDFSVSGTAVWKEVSRTTPMMNGKPMTFIPAFPLNGSIEIQEPIMQPLIDREVGLYNKISRRNHLLYGAATYTPVISSSLSDEQQDEIVNAGLGSWIFLDTNGKADILSAPTEALKDMESSIAATIEEMARMGIRMLSPEGSSAESGVSLEIRNAAQTAQLGLLNVKVSKTMQSIIALMLAWKYDVEVNEDEIDFNLSQDFNPTPMGDAWMRLVTEWYQGGLIPRTLWLAIGKQNDVIPVDYDDDKGKEEILTDPLVETAATKIDSELDGAPGDAKEKPETVESKRVKERKTTTVEKFHGKA
jgi:hypothetical protein